MGSVMVLDQAQVNAGRWHNADCVEMLRGLLESSVHYSISRRRSHRCTFSDSPRDVSNNSDVSRVLGALPVRDRWHLSRTSDRGA